MVPVLQINMNRILNISEAASLAIHSLVFIAKNDDIQYTTPLLAKELHASVHHLSKVLQRLNKSGYITSNRGRNGGFSISEDIKKIKLLNIYEAIDGKFNTDACIMHHCVCTGTDCIMGDINKNIISLLFDYLQNTSIYDIAVGKGHTL
jgi:Rrf2 family protein